MQLDLFGNNVKYEYITTINDLFVRRENFMYKKDALNCGENSHINTLNTTYEQIFGDILHGRYTVKTVVFSRSLNNECKTVKTLIKTIE